ncbi:MAG: hypothetical protein B1H09_05115 [Gemmatimonadaceae bacterium 4484_173]|nr:MAG: hypothetical protein B1H09_05115 [Gemmatimonadaceae bacterium 4484_173]
MCDDIPGIVLMGGKSYNISIVRSTDYCSTWTTVLNDFPVEITDIEQDPLNPSHMIASGYSSGSGGSSEFYQSNDHGETWTASSAVLNGIRVNDMMFSDCVPNRYYCATDSGIYQTDDGVSFTKVFNLETLYLESGPTHPGQIFAACGENGVYRCTGPEAAWEQLPAFYHEGISVETVELVGDQWLYAGTDGFGVYRISLDPLGPGDNTPDSPEPAVTVLSSPGYSSITLQVSPLTLNSTLTVHDISGRVVYTGTLPASAVTQQVVLNDLSSGIYFAGISSHPGFCRFVMLER